MAYAVFHILRNEYEHNGENLQKAIQQYLGGIDKASVNVWMEQKRKKVTLKRYRNDE